MSVNHHLLAKITTDQILFHFKSGNWTIKNTIGKNFYRVGCSSNFPSPDAAFRDDVNKIIATFEFKPPTETKRGILTGLGQSLAYLDASNLSYLVIPEYLGDFNLSNFMENLFTHQITGKIPMGLISYENNTPKNVKLLQNVNFCNNKVHNKKLINNRFWAKHQDLPIPLFHLLLHCYYLKKTKLINEDAFVYCWNKYLFPKENLHTLESTEIYDIQGNPIRTLSSIKKQHFFEKRMKKINQLEGLNREKAILKLKKDADPSFIGDNSYNSWRKNYITFLKHIGMIDSEGNLTEIGLKLYHLGVTNGPQSKLFRDYFTKIILLDGHHLDIIFDLDRLCNQYKGQEKFSEIKRKLLLIYETKGMIKRNPNRKVNTTSKVNFLKYEDILWNSLDLKQKSSGIPEAHFNWEKITEVCSLPPL